MCMWMRTVCIRGIMRHTSHGTGIRNHHSYHDIYHHACTILHVYVDEEHMEERVICALWRRSEKGGEGRRGERWVVGEREEGGLSRFDVTTLFCPEIKNSPFRH